MLDAQDLFENTITPTLKKAGLYTLAAAKLVLYTAGHESLMGKYDRQIKGPALSIYMIEPATYWDVAPRRKTYLTELGYTEIPPPIEMIEDLQLATLICRLKYLDFKEALPNYDDLPGMAAYWKKYYNTPLGKGTEQEFIKNNKSYTSIV